VDPGLLRDENREVSPPDAVLGQCELQEPLTEDEARILDHFQAAKETYEKLPHVTDRRPALRGAEQGLERRIAMCSVIRDHPDGYRWHRGVLGASGRRRRPFPQRRLKGRRRLAAPSSHLPRRRASPPLR